MSTMQQLAVAQQLQQQQQQVGFAEISASLISLFWLLLQ